MRQKGADRLASDHSDPMFSRRTALHSQSPIEQDQQFIQAQNTPTLAFRDKETHEIEIRLAAGDDDADGGFVAAHVRGRGAGVILREHALQRRVVALDVRHGVVHKLADGGRGRVRVARVVLSFRQGLHLFRPFRWKTALDQPDPILAYIHLEGAIPFREDWRLIVHDALFLWLSRFGKEKIVFAILHKRNHSSGKRAYHRESIHRR